MAAAESTPRVAALAEQQVVLLTVHSSSLAMLFAAVFYGLAVSLTVSYFRRSAGLSDPIFVQLYVLTTIAGGTACLAVQATTLYRDLTTLVMGASTSTSRFTVLQVLEAWVCATFAVEVKAYYVYRAICVTKHRILQALAVLLGLCTVGGFLGCAIVTLRIRLGEAIPSREAHAYTLAAAWAFAVDGLLCASILVYELVYKRRAVVVKSSLVQQFTTVALRSSVALLPLLFSMAVMMTIGFATQDPVRVQTGLAMSRIFPFVSCCIVFTCLLERGTLTSPHTDTTTSDTLGTRTTKHSMPYSSLEQRPSQQLYNLAILSPEHSPHLDKHNSEECSACRYAPRDETFGEIEAQATSATGLKASAQVSWVGRDQRTSSHSEDAKTPDEEEQISLRSFLRRSLV